MPALHATTSISVRILLLIIGVISCVALSVFAIFRLRSLLKKSRSFTSQKGYFLLLLGLGVARTSQMALLTKWAITNPNDAYIPLGIFSLDALGFSFFFAASTYILVFWEGISCKLAEGQTKTNFFRSPRFRWVVFLTLSCLMLLVGIAFMVFRFDAAAAAVPAVHNAFAAIEAVVDALVLVAYALLGARLLRALAAASAGLDSAFLTRHRTRIKRMLAMYVSVFFVRCLFDSLVFSSQFDKWQQVHYAIVALIVTELTEVFPSFASCYFLKTELQENSAAQPPPRALFTSRDRMETMSAAAVGGDRFSDHNYTAL